LTGSNISEIQFSAISLRKPIASCPSLLVSAR
jgi:hypothetical protein